MARERTSRVRSACVSWRRASWLAALSPILRAADNARQIVDEAQKRTDAKSQRYEGLLQVFDAKGKISDKRWTLERLGVARPEQGRCCDSPRRPK